jgi:hypothetical protein
MEKMTRDDVMRETVKHVRRVGNLMLDVIERLSRRAMQHDDSKFSEVEFPAFAAETPGLKELTYGSDEYKAAIKRLGPALDHHQFCNSHHPEYYAWDSIGQPPDFDECVKNGTAFGKMDLLDLIEMLADWKAATERHADGDLRRSIQQNAARFGYGDGTVQLLMQTAERLGWLLPAQGP